MPRISELPALAQATSGDVIPIVDDAGNITKKVTADKVVPDGSVVTDQIADGAVTAAKIDFTALDFQSYSPTVVGFSVLPSGGIYRHRRIGNTVDVFIRQPNAGTSNSTALTISLPYTAATITGMEWQVPIVQTQDNGTTNTTTPGIAVVSSGATVITCFRNLSGSIWTASGSKRAGTFMITYECVP